MSNQGVLRPAWHNRREPGWHQTYEGDYARGPWIIRHDDPRESGSAWWTLSSKADPGRKERGFRTLNDAKRRAAWLDVEGRSAVHGAPRSRST